MSNQDEKHQLSKSDLPSLSDIRGWYQWGNHSPLVKGYNILNLPDDLFEWLLSALHNNPSPTPRPDLPWNDLITGIHEHRMSACLSYILSHHPTDVHPAQEWMESLNRASDQQKLSWFRTIIQISRLHQLLTGAGVRYLLLKGSALGWQVYPHPSLRDGIDIDILIDESSISVVSDLLSSNGYRLRFDSMKVSEHLFHHQVFFPETEVGIKTVEVHWRPLALPGVIGSVTTSDLLNRAQYLKTEIGTIPALSLPDALIYGALHMNIGHSNELRLIWIEDIRRLCLKISETERWNEVEELVLIWDGIESLQRTLVQAFLWTGVVSPVFSTGWPSPSPEELLLYRHLDLRRSGDETSLHEQIRRMTSLKEKTKALFHYIFATSVIRQSHPDASCSEYIRAWWSWWSPQLMKILTGKK